MLQKQRSLKDFWILLVKKRQPTLADEFKSFCAILSNLHQHVYSCVVIAILPLSESDFRALHPHLVTAKPTISPRLITLKQQDRRRVLSEGGQLTEIRILLRWASGLQGVSIRWPSSEYLVPHYLFQLPFQPLSIHYPAQILFYLSQEDLFHKFETSSHATSMDTKIFQS